MAASPSHHEYDFCTLLLALGHAQQERPCQGRAHLHFLPVWPPESDVLLFIAPNVPKYSQKVAAETQVLTKSSLLPYKWSRESTTQDGLSVASILLCKTVMDSVCLNVSFHS